MLYDNVRWDNQTKVDPFSLASLIAWLEKQPANKQYIYIDKQNCLVAQYLRQAGVRPYALDSEDVVSLFGGHGSKIVQGLPDRTFGAALERAKAAQRGEYNAV